FCQRRGLREDVARADAPGEGTLGGRLPPDPRVAEGTGRQRGRRDRRRLAPAVLSSAWTGRSSGTRDGRGRAPRRPAAEARWHGPGVSDLARLSQRGGRSARPRVGAALHWQLELRPGRARRPRLDGHLRVPAPPARGGDGTGDLLHPEPGCGGRGPHGVRAWGVAAVDLLRQRAVALRRLSELPTAGHAERRHAPP